MRRNGTRRADKALIAVYAEARIRVDDAGSAAWRAQDAIPGFRWTRDLDHVAVAGAASRVVRPGVRRAGTRVGRHRPCCPRLELLIAIVWLDDAPRFETLPI